MSERRHLAVPIEAMLRAIRHSHRSLSKEEFAALLSIPDTDEEAAERREQIRWFTTRYPTPALRLAKARESYRQWARTIPPEALAEERRLRNEEAARPIRRPLDEEEESTAD